MFIEIEGNGKDNNNFKEWINKENIIYDKIVESGQRVVSWCSGNNINIHSIFYVSDEPPWPPGPMGAGCRLNIRLTKKSKFNHSHVFEILYQDNRRTYKYPKENYDYGPYLWDGTIFYYWNNHIPNIWGAKTMNKVIKYFKLKALW